MAYTIKYTAVLILLLLVASSFPEETSIGVECFVCDAKLHKGCGQKPNVALLAATGHVKGPCMACSKIFVGLGTAWEHVTRACMTSPIDTCVNILGYGKCYCKSDLCNGARNVRPTHTVLFALFAVFLVFRTI